MRKFTALLMLLFFTASAFAGNNAHFFTENKGQIVDSKGNVRNDILFYTEIKGGRMYFMPGMVSFVMSSSEKKGDVLFTKGTRTDIDIENLSGRASFTGSDELPSYSNFYLPHCKNGILHVRNFRDIKIENYFQGMDLAFYFDDKGKLTYDYFRNGKKMPACNPLGKDPLPSFLLKVKDVTENVSCTQWSTYYGGASNDEGWGIAVDDSGSTYTSGYTIGTDFPVSTGSFQGTSNGNYDSFIVKMDSCGYREWSTYIGSSGNDFGEKICMCGNNAVQCGYTSGNDFPVSANAWQLNSNGGYESFLFKIDPSGARVWATYFGGSGGELGAAICCDMNKNIFLGGGTSSTDLPVQNAFQPLNNGPMEAFIAKFDSNGTRRWATYYGGTSSEDVHSMCTDNSGNVIAVGGTFSSNLNISVGAFQQGSNGAQDAYIIKFDSTGSRIFSTYFGGAGNEDAFGVCTDALKNIYVSGYTTSGDFPVTGNVYQSSINNGDDIYIAAFTPTGAQTWCTYFGGSGNEEVYGMSTDNNGHLFIIANTNSTDLPVLSTAYQMTLGGMQDAFVLKCSTAGTPLWSTYFGGTLDDAGYDIAASAQMKVFFTGFTNSTDLPVTTGPFQPNNAGPEDAYITKLNGAFDITTTISENNSSSICTVYPDPSYGSFYITVNGTECDARISIYDAAGKKVSEKIFTSLTQGNNTLLYDASGLEQGLYFINITVGTRREVKKLIIVN